MIRFSQRGWNNVIIVCMLLLIVLFNTSSNFLNNNEADPQQFLPLLPTNSVLMTLDFGSHKIERIGRGWRVLSNKNQAPIEQGAVDDLVTNWQQASIKPSEGPIQGQKLVVVAWLAGQDQGRVYQFYQSGQSVLVEVEQQRYQLSSLTLNQLLLPGEL